MSLPNEPRINSDISATSRFAPIASGRNGCCRENASSRCVSTAARRAPSLAAST